MKKLIIPFLLLVACRSANHDSRYAITDDTMKLRDTLLFEHTGCPAQRV